MVQALAAWRWYNYVADQVPAEKRILRLNIDETSVCLFQGSGRGNVFVSKKRRVSQHVSRATRRRCMTHVGVICDNTYIQPHLPQVLIGNWATFKAGSMTALRGRAPANVVLLRQKSAWNNEAVCAWIVRRIGRALAPYTHEYQPVLLMDVSRIHTARSVLVACHAAGIWVVLIPALLTWLLQPLDTHGFQRYKAHLRNKYLEARIAAAGDALEVGEFLPCVYSAVLHVLQGIRWVRAFDDDGFGAQQSLVSARILDRLGPDRHLEVPRTRPADAELAHCFPRGAAVPTALLWRPFNAAVAPCAMRAPACAPSVVAGSAVVVALREPRTRAEHRAATAARAVATPTPAAALAPSASSSSSSAAPAAVSAPRIFGRTRSQTRLLKAMSEA